MPEPAPQPVPDGMSTVTAHLWFKGDCREAIGFYEDALGGALVSDVVPTPDGSAVWHAMLQVGDSRIMMADAMPGGIETGPDAATTVGFWLYVDDSDLWYGRAVAAGCEVIDEIQDMFWGDRVGKVRDPYGHVWAFATHKWNPTEEDMAASMSG